MSNYSEKFKNPLWQKKRLEKLEESGFQCENCGKDEKELHVHHRHYDKGKNPWEYENYDLIVFCTDCHTEWHEAKSKIDKIIGQINDAKSIYRICGYAMPMRSEIDIFPGEISNKETGIGIADYYRTNFNVVCGIYSSALEKSEPLSFQLELSLQVFTLD